MCDGKSFEYIMGLHGAPLLIGLKPASLISFRKDKFTDFDGLLAAYLPCFACKGISVYTLQENAANILLLFFRSKTMEKTLRDGGRRDLLTAYGYNADSSLAELLAELKRRMTQGNFPHEIGLFLGYPPQDVQGFIEQKGRGFSYSGYWKVYANEGETRRLFALYTRCTKEFCQKLAAGENFAAMLKAG